MKKTRVLIGILGMDQHEVGAISVARLLRDAGMEVIYLAKFNLPDTIIKAALQEDADIIGLSCHSWEYLDYLPQLMELLKKEGLNIPVVLGGSVITSEDVDKLKTIGVAAAFTSGAQQKEIIDTIQTLVAGDGSAL